MKGDEGDEGDKTYTIKLRYEALAKVQTLSFPQSF